MNLGKETAGSLKSLSVLSRGKYAVPAAHVFKRVLSIFLVTLSVALLCSAQMNFDSGFPVKEMEPTRKESFLNNVSITPLSEMPEGYNISRFDVNEDGKIDENELAALRRILINK